MSAEASIRHAYREDVPIILSFIKAAANEQYPEASVEATESCLAAAIRFDESPQPSDTDSLERPQASCLPCIRTLLISAPDGTVAGMAIYFFNFSTWRGGTGISLEELYVLPEYRRWGYAKRLIEAMAKVALEEGCVKMDWLCLNDNQRALNFYDKVGAKRMDWTAFKVDKVGIEALAKGDSQASLD